MSDSKQRQTLPEGEYVTVVKEVQLKTSRAGNPYRQATFEVTEGPRKGRLAWAGFNLDHPNEKAAEMAAREWASFCEACGIDPDPAQEDGSAAAGSAVRIGISHREGSGGRVWADVSSFETA